MWTIPDPLSWIPPGDPGHSLMRFIIASLNTESPQDTARIFCEFMEPHQDDLRWYFKYILRLAKHLPYIFTAIFRMGTSLFFTRRFIAANGDRDVARIVPRTMRAGLKANFDILGEAVTSEKQAQCYTQSYLALIKQLMPLGEEISVSLKPSAFYSQAQATSPEYAAQEIVKRIGPVISLLEKVGGHAYLDAEEYEMLEAQKLVFKTLYKEYGSAVRFVLQAYLKDSFEILQWLILINNPQDPIRLRLVRGAYWDHECMHAQKMGWDDPPVFTDKDETDLMYHVLLWQGMRHGLVVNLGTHNTQSILNAVNSYISLRAWGHFCHMPEFQILHGMPGVPKFSKVLHAKGYSVRIYKPIRYPTGDMNEAMAYLVRRILENQSQASFLVQHAGFKMREANDCLERMPALKDTPNMIKKYRLPKEEL